MVVSSCDDWKKHQPDLLKSCCNRNRIYDLMLHHIKQFDERRLISKDHSLQKGFVGGKTMSLLSPMMQDTGYTLRKLVFVKSESGGCHQILHTDAEVDFITMLYGINCRLRLNVNLSTPVKTRHFVHGGSGAYRGEPSLGRL